MNSNLYRVNLAKLRKKEELYSNLDYNFIYKFSFFQLQYLSINLFPFISIYFIHQLIIITNLLLVL